MPTKACFLVVTLILLLIACEKEKSFSTSRGGSADGSRLTKAVWRWHDSAFYSFYYYDDQNRLSRIVDSENTNFSKRFTSFVYNADGRLVKKIYTNDYNSDAGVDSFLYDDKNNIAEKKYSDSYMASIGISGKNTYAYDGQGRLVGDTTYSYWTDKIFEYVNYTYDGNDDLVSWQEFRDEGGIMKSDGTTFVAYN